MALRTTHFEIDNLQADLIEFQEEVESINMQKVYRTTAKEAATTLAEMVRQAVVAEDKIKTPASLWSPYDSGPGPSLSERNAWMVTGDGDQYIVKPKPKVEQRATVLNAGWGTITPNSAPKLAFNVGGIAADPNSSNETGVVRTESVDGPDKTGYWQAALRRFEASDEFKRIGLQELREEALR